MSLEISEYSMEEENQRNENQEEEIQIKGNHIKYFSRLFLIKKIIKEDEIIQILQTSFSGITTAPLIRELNETFQAYRMEIKRTINQSTGDYLYGLNTKDIDEINQMGCIFDQQDLKKQNDLFTLMIENNYRLSINSLDEDFFEVYNRMKQMGYYIEKDDIITFGPMYLINQEIDDLHLPRCEICNLYGTIGLLCPKDDCQTFYHETCLKRLGRDSHLCVKCRTHLN